MKEMWPKSFRRMPTRWKVHPLHLISGITQSIDRIYCVGHLPSPKLYRLPARTLTYGDPGAWAHVSTIKGRVSHLSAMERYRVYPGMS